MYALVIKAKLKKPQKLPLKVFFLVVEDGVRVKVLQRRIYFFPLEIFFQLSGEAKI